MKSVDRINKELVTTDVETKIENKDDAFYHGRAYIARATLDNVIQVFSTPTDTASFNEWYYEELNKKLTKPSLNNLKEKLVDSFKYKSMDVAEGLSNSSRLSTSDTNQHCSSCSFNVTKEDQEYVATEPNCYLNENSSPVERDCDDKELYSQVCVSQDLVKSNSVSFTMLTYLQAYLIIIILLGKSCLALMEEFAKYSRFQSPVVFLPLKF